MINEHALLSVSATQDMFASTRVVGSFFSRESAEFRLKLELEGKRDEERKGMDGYRRATDHPSPFLICIPRCFSNTPA